MSGTWLPKQEHVEAVRELFDLMDEFRDNDQRARYLLSSDWMREHGAEAADHGSQDQPSTPTAAPTSDGGSLDVTQKARVAALYVAHHVLSSQGIASRSGASSDALITVAQYIVTGRTPGDSEPQPASLITVTGMGKADLPDTGRRVRVAGRYTR